jgi:hypothetical protein
MMIWDQEVDHPKKSARHEGGDVSIGVARSKPNQGATGVSRGTTPLSSKPKQEAVQASIASIVVRAVKPPSSSSTNKRRNKISTKRRRDFVANPKWKSKKGQSKNLIILIWRLMMKTFETRNRELRQMRRCADCCRNYAKTRLYPYLESRLYPSWLRNAPPQ